jgi:hypothetical protein
MQSPTRTPWRQVQGDTWRLTENDDLVVLEPRWPPRYAVQFVAMTLAGLLAGLMYGLFSPRHSDWISIGWVLIATAGIIAYGIFREGLVERRSGPWLVLDRRSHTVHLPRLGRNFPTERVFVVLSTETSILLGTIEANGPEEILVLRADASPTLHRAFHRSVRPVRLGEELASRLGVPYELYLPGTSCDACGYDLRGTFAAGATTCPECGAKGSAWRAMRSTLRPPARDERDG